MAQTLQVTALRDDILRVRLWKGNAEPEDASWAVLPESRASRVPVTAEARGFATKALRGERRWASAAYGDGP